MTVDNARPKQGLDYSKDIKVLSNSTSTPKKYNWVEVYRDTTGVWNEMPLSKGNITYDPAYERNNQLCPANTICRADRDSLTGQLVFTHRSQVVTNEQAPGLYTAYFFPPPLAFSFDIIIPGNYPLGSGALYSKEYIRQVGGPECSRYDAYTTEVLYPDGTVYYSKSYSTTSNPLLKIDIVPLPVLPVGQSFKVKYTVYPYDGNIIQMFQDGYSQCIFLFPGDRYYSPAQDIHYISCPFTEFQGGTYGQLKYECSGLSPLLSIGMPPYPQTVWPLPNFFPLKIAPSSMSTSLSMSIGPNVGQVDYWKAQTVLNWINTVASRTLPNLNAGLRATKSIFNNAFQQNTDPTPSVTVGNDTYYMNIDGSAEQGFTNIPGMTQGFYPCDTQTQGWFVASEGGFFIKASWGPYFYPGRLGRYQTYPPQASPKNQSQTYNPPLPAFTLYGVQFYTNSISISFS